jgi:radial spoke head protein 4A
MRKLIERPREETEEGSVEVAPEGISHIPDILSQGEMLKWAGIYFGEEDSYRLQMSLKRLMATSGASQLRFWGKIYGTTADYYIAEGIGGTEEELEEYPEDFERKGAGVNTYTYWATSDLLGTWVELPDIRP